MHQARIQRPTQEKHLIPATYSKNYFQSARMFKIEHSATNCAYFSKNVHMQEFAFDTICVCTWWQACSEHACFEMLYGLSTSACTYALKVLSIWHSGSEIWQNLSDPEIRKIVKNPTFGQSCDFGDSSDFRVRTRIWPKSRFGAKPGSDLPESRFWQV